jgi:universal stress protein E
MQRLDRILAVIDPTVDAQPGVDRAARLARGAGAALELFECDFAPALTGAPFFDTDALRRQRDDYLAGRRGRLEQYAVELRRDGLQVTTEVRWDNPLHVGILRRIKECAPDLVVKDTHYHSPLRRTFFSNTDWQLVRTCPVPLLLAKAADWPREPRIVAAVDPSHRHAKPAALDGDILDAALRVAKCVDGQVEAVHAFFPAALLAATAGVAGVPLATDVATTELLEAERSRIEQDVVDLAASRSLGRDAARLLQGAAAEVLPRYLDQVRASLLVMGAISRSRLQEFFIGSTAERVLDRLPCDVLVVKPPDFAEGLPF